MNVVTPPLLQSAQLKPDVTITSTDSDNDIDESNDERQDMASSFVALLIHFLNFTSMTKFKRILFQGLAVDKVVEAGIGLVNLHQAVDFYNSMHSYMAGAGATGVKVNVIHIYLADYNHDKAEQSVLWTLSADVGNGYQCLRPVNNINLNMDAKAADGHVGGIRDGNEIILFEWKKHSNQKWKLQPVH